MAVKTFIFVCQWQVGGIGMWSADALDYTNKSMSDAMWEALLLLKPMKTDDIGSSRHHPCVSHGSANATCFGFNATDSTAILQAAFDLPLITNLTIDRHRDCDVTLGTRNNNWRAVVVG